MYRAVDLSSRSPNMDIDIDTDLDMDILKFGCWKSDFEKMSDTAPLSPISEVPISARTDICYHGYRTTVSWLTPIFVIMDIVLSAHLCYAVGIHVAICLKNQIFWVPFGAVFSSGNDSSIVIAVLSIKKPKKMKSWCKVGNNSCCNIYFGDISHNRCQYYADRSSRSCHRILFNTTGSE